MDRWREDFHQKCKIQVSARFTSMVYSRDTEVSLLISCSLKVTQYMYETTSQLYSIWMSVPKVLYRQVAPSKNERKTYDLRSLALRLVFYTVLVCLSLTNCNLLQNSAILFCFYLDIKKIEKLTIILQKGKNMSP